MLGETFSEFVTSCSLSACLGGLIGVSDVNTRTDLRYATTYITTLVITKATKANLQKCIGRLHLQDCVTFSDEGIGPPKTNKQTKNKQKKTRKSMDSLARIQHRQTVHGLPKLADRCQETSVSHNIYGSVQSPFFPDDGTASFSAFRV